MRIDEDVGRQRRSMELTKIMKGKREIKLEYIGRKILLYKNISLRRQNKVLVGISVMFVNIQDILWEM